MELHDEKLAEVSVRVVDLRSIHLTLSMTRDCLAADDIARCHRLMAAPAYSPLTNEITARMERVEGLLKDYFAEVGMAQYVEGEEPMEPAEPIQALALSNDPLGEKAALARSKAPKLALTDDEEAPDDASS